MLITSYEFGDGPFIPLANLGNDVREIIFRLRDV
jgi:hypothetical protein